MARRLLVNRLSAHVEVLLGHVAASGTLALLLATATLGLGGSETGSARSTCVPHAEVIATPVLPDAFLQGVAVTPGGQVWAVGGSIGADESVILRWNGKAMERVPSPSRRGPVAFNELRDVVAPASNDAWAAGVDGVLHWDGQRWRHVAAPPGSLWGISASGPKAVWAVGKDTLTSVLVIRFDGRSWKKVPFAAGRSPSPPPPDAVSTVSSGFLEGVLALAKDDVWIAGTTVGDMPITAHWNGRTWTMHDVEQAPFGQGLASLAAVSSHDVWAAGGDRGGGLIAHWDGIRWRVRGDFAGAYDIAIVNRTEVWTIIEGPDGTEAISRWNGSTWTPIERPHTDYTLHGLAAATNGDVWAVGWRLGNKVRSRPLVLRFRCAS